MTAQVELDTLIPTWDHGSVTVWCDCEEDGASWDVAAERWLRVDGQEPIPQDVFHCESCGLRWRFPHPDLVRAYVESEGRYDRFVWRPGDLRLIGRDKP